MIVLLHWKMQTGFSDNTLSVISKLVQYYTFI